MQPQGGPIEAGMPSGMGQPWAMCGVQGLQNRAPGACPPRRPLPPGSLPTPRVPRSMPCRPASLPPRAPSQPQQRWRTSAQPPRHGRGGRPGRLGRNALSPKTAPPGAPTPRARLRLRSGAQLQLPGEVRYRGAGGPGIRIPGLSMGTESKKSVVFTITDTDFRGVRTRARCSCRGRELGWAAMCQVAAQAPDGPHRARAGGAQCRHHGAREGGAGLGTKTGSFGGSETLGPWFSLGFALLPLPSPPIWT